MASSKETSKSGGSATPGTIVATLIHYGEGPFVIGRLILADGAASSHTDTSGLLRHAFDALQDDGATVIYLTTPAGFHRGPLPSGWTGSTGWKSSAGDFTSLVSEVESIAETLARGSNAHGGPVRYLSLGIDLRGSKGKAHIETSVLYDTKAQRVIGVTGKSYPTIGQERELIRNPLSSNHIVEADGTRSLTLVCHDLSMFHPRGRAVRGHTRERAARALEDLIAREKPSIALHQAHTVESPMTWTLAWNALRRQYESSLRGWTTAFRYRGLNDAEPKSPLSRDVLDGTRGGDLPAIDVILSSQATARGLTSR